MHALIHRLSKWIIAALLLSFFQVGPIAPALAAVGDADSVIVLNGTNQSAEVADPGSSVFDLTTAVTLEAWVYATSACTNSGGQGIVTKDVSYMLYCVSGKWGYAFSGDGTSWTGQSTSMPVEQNAWHHIALTHSSAAANVNFYFDGQLLETLSTSMPATMGTNNNPLRIGNFGPGYYFNGKIDEVRIYSTKRTDAQILTDMKTWGPANETGLIGYYDFNDESGSTVLNAIASPAANTNLTTYNSPTYAAVENSAVVNGDQVVTFPRSYLVANGGWKIPSHISTLKSLVIAGGGSGGSRAGGGGGAGGYVYDTSLSVTPDSYQSIVVGSGGAGYANSQGKNGLNSTLGSLRTALGGGGGGHASGANNVTRAGVDGGSGGGASGDANSVGSSAAYGLTKQNANYSYGVGFNGGSGYNGGAWASGGGGGAGGAGANSNGPANTAGKGGLGITDPIGGTSTCYATGGGGGVLVGYTLGAGGDCSGSATPNNNAGTAGSSSPGVGFARANTGSGGGGSGYNASGADYAGGHGASGIIILRYALLTNVSLSFSGGSIATYRTTGTITAVTSIAGKVTFYERGKVIPRCRNIATDNSLTATCSWKPSVHGMSSISATSRPTNSYVSTASSSLTVSVIKRSTPR